MPITECSCCHRVADSRSFRRCCDCGAPLCDECANLREGLCDECFDADQP